MIRLFLIPMLMALMVDSQFVHAADRLTDDTAATGEFDVSEPPCVVVSVSMRSLLDAVSTPIPPPDLNRSRLAAPVVAIALIRLLRPLRLNISDLEVDCADCLAPEEGDHSFEETHTTKHIPLLPASNAIDHGLLVEVLQNETSYVWSYNPLEHSQCARFPAWEPPLGVTLPQASSCRIPQRGLDLTELWSIAYHLSQSSLRDLQPTIHILGYC